MGVLVIAMNFISNVWVAAPFLILLGGLGGFLVVPMNALLQHRGHNLMGAGRSIAVQNFNEQACILGLGAFYSLSAGLGLSAFGAITAFGVVVAGVMWLIQRWHAQQPGQAQGRGRPPAGDRAARQRRMAERGRRAAPALALVFNAFVWGVSWWPFRELQEHGLHPLWATALIYLVSLACAAGLRPRAWRGCADQPLLWLLALAAGLTNVGFNWAVTVGDVVRVVLLFYLMPAWSRAAGLAAAGRAARRGAALARLALALAGVAIVLRRRRQRPGRCRSSLADWLALMGGFSFALTNVLLRRLHAGAGRGARAGDVRRRRAAGGRRGAGRHGAGRGRRRCRRLAPAGCCWRCCSACGFLAGNLALQYGAARLPAHTTALVMLSEVVFASLSLGGAGRGRTQRRARWPGGALILRGRAPGRPGRAGGCRSGAQWRA